MKAEIKSVATINLRLTLQEARWVKAVMQNPLGPDESQRDSEIRERLFNCLASLTGV